MPRYATRRARARLYDAEDWHGTSLAAALVSATCLLCLAKNPRLTVEEVRAALHSGADRVDGQAGFTYRLGWGRLNVERTLAAVTDDA